MSKHLLISLTALFTACGSSDVDPETDAVTPNLGAGKADVIDRVQDQGQLEFDRPRAGAFVEDLEFHGYQLSVREGSRVRVEITRRGTAARIDTTLFVYGPGQVGGFGTDAIAFDDDAGWGRHSRIRGLELAGGTYLVVVGTGDGRGRGAYRLLATCETGECAPLPEPVVCDADVATAIRACVDTQLADSAADPEVEPLNFGEAVEICSDGEALGPVFDGLCLVPAPADFCASGFDSFAQSMGPLCAAELTPPAACVFGEAYRDLFSSRDLVLGDARVLTSPVGLGDVERVQVLRAVQSSAHTDVTTVEEAFGRPDGGEINRTELWDRSGARAYVVYEFGAGDTSVGAYFELAGTQPVAVINDGFVEGCTAAPGPQGHDCTDAAACSVGQCLGSSAASDVGRCVDTSGFGPEVSCSQAAPCDLGQGLICAGLTRGTEGICLPAWMRGTFSARDVNLAIPDGDPQGIASSLVVHGLATVDMDVELEVFLSHPDSGQVEVSLVNPAGAEVTVFAGAGAEVTPLRRPVLGFSGDEMVNGEWTLRVVDPVAGSAGSLDGWRLHLGSRFD